MGTKIFSGNILQIVCNYLAQTSTVFGILSITYCTAVRGRIDRNVPSRIDRNAPQE